MVNIYNKRQVGDIRTDASGGSAMMTFALGTLALVLAWTTPA